MQTIAAFMIALTIMLGVAACEVQRSSATVGGTTVPITLACAEDELIGFVGVGHARMRSC